MIAEIETTNHKTSPAVFDVEDNKQSKDDGADGTNVDRTLDNILVRIGQFGRFQLLNYVLLCIPMMFNAFCSISYAFTASTVVHRCNVTQCDSPTSGYYEPWLNYTIPMKGSNYEQCTRFVAKNKRAESFATKYSNTSSESCTPDYFHQGAVEKCENNFKFRDEVYTISNEFSIFCSNVWKLSMVGTVSNIGQFVGIPLGGFISDHFGRRTTLAVCGFLSAIMGLLRSISSSYYMFITFEFLDLAVGATLYQTAFLLAIELVGLKRRVAATTIITVFYPLGEVLLAALAQKFQNWRHLLRVLYTPALLHIVFLLILPESVRWLLSQGKEEEVSRLLKRAARINKREISEEDLKVLISQNRMKLQQSHESSYPIWKALKLFRWRFINCCLCWFTHKLIGLGLSLTSVTLAGNKYVNFQLSGLIQMPALILPLFIMDKIGRRYSLCGSMLICAICMLGATLVGANNATLQLVLFLMGKFAITCSLQILYFFTSEIFPTNIRNSMLSLCSMAGRFGSMLSPQGPLLASYYEFAPQILFASFALLSGTSTLLFPETTDKALPTTLHDAEHLSDKKQKDLPKNID
ncbi:organic cation/carnitine transporter 2-like [Eurosta solidaginis]|uniref:organic cation/carnitine transporter 2-like n=1 Tax=Eurosta solidaginis TaxID=178769 RepID=UPI003530C816